MKQKSVVKPRNAFVALAKFRRAGAHEKTHKAIRRAAKVKLNQEI